MEIGWSSLFLNQVTLTSLPIHARYLSSPLCPRFAKGQHIHSLLIFWTKMVKFQNCKVVIGDCTRLKLFYFISQMKSLVMSKAFGSTAYVMIWCCLWPPSRNCGRTTRLNSWTSSILTVCKWSAIGPYSLPRNGLCGRNKNFPRPSPKSNFRRSYCIKWGSFGNCKMVLYNLPSHQPW